MISRTRTTTTLAAAALTFAWGIACQTPADKDREAEKTRAEAQSDQRKSEAHVQQLENKADQEHREAMTSLEKKRAEYRANIESQAAETDERVDKLKTAMADDSPEAAMRDVTARRGELAAALQHLDQATPANWNDVKARVDEDLDAYRSAERTASSRIEGRPSRLRARSGRLGDAG